MQKHVGWGWIIGLFAMVTANAQTSSPPAPSTQFDGIYAFVSGSKVSETYWTWNGHPEPCPDLPSTALTIIKGQVRFDQQEGTVGPNNELSTRLIPTPFGKGGGNVGIEIPHYGRIHENGTIRLRRTGYNCSYDLIWKKVQNVSFPIPSTQFDGTYALVSSTKSNESYMNRMTEQTDQCPERPKPQALTIINGQAHLPKFQGTVGSHGELAMIRVDRVQGTFGGVIDRNGTVKARRTIGDCSYDIVWQNRFQVETCREEPNN